VTKDARKRAKEKADEDVARRAGSNVQRESRRAGGGAARIPGKKEKDKSAKSILDICVKHNISQ